MGACEVLGLDSSQKMIDKSLKKNKYENIHYMVCSLDEYAYPGKRETIFLGEKVVKQHHTLTQIINPLLQTGFRIEAIEEAMPPENMMHLPGMKDEMRRPMMLLVKAVKY